jgi:prepilin-type N-terminal cleavage/methylation domain-containing protein
MNKSTRNGFTLIELTIVIVILGIVITGAVAGQSIIRSAELSSQVSQLNSYNQAILSFKLEYDDLPGDLENATDYELHRDKSGTTNSCRTSTASEPLSYDGDGDGYLEDAYGDTIVTFSGEIMNFYIHLNNAGLLDQNIRKNVNTSYCHMVHMDTGVQFPEAEMRGGLITIQSNKKLYHILGSSSDQRHFYISLTSHNTDPSQYGLSGNRLSAVQAKRLDDKIDDGKPLRGIVKVLEIHQRAENISGEKDYGVIQWDSKDNPTNCIYNASYNITYKEEACSIAIQAPI